MPVVRSAECTTSPRKAQSLRRPPDLAKQMHRGRDRMIATASRTKPIARQQAVDTLQTAETQQATDTQPGHLAEGIVFHHPDGRRAKIKRKDFAAGRAQDAG